MYATANPQIDRLINTLAILPSHWRLVPTNGNKQPLGCQWQNYPFSPHQLLTCLAQRGQVAVMGQNRVPYAVVPQGIGLLCGQTAQEFLLAVDCDGYSAHQRLHQLARGRSLPTTVAFTSGRLGRAQYLFALPNPVTPFRSRRIATAPGEALEIRGSGLQSILPPSPHPLTGSYRWLPGCRPDQVAVALAPDWLSKLLKTSIRQQKYAQIQFLPSISLGNCQTSLEMARLLLEVIQPQFADNYHTWIFTGMALKYVSNDLFLDWDAWSQLSSKYVPGECAYKWASFRGQGISDRYLHYLAQLS